MGENDRIRHLEAECDRLRAELAGTRAHGQRMEQQLLRANREWQRTFDSVPDLVTLVDREHRILRVNRAMAKRLGCSAEQCEGQKCYVCVHGLDAPPNFCPHSQTIADGLEHSAEVYEERLGGHFLVSCTPLFDDRGEFVASVHVARDITERKRTEAAIRNLAQFAEVNPNPVLRAAGDGRVLYANGPATELLADMDWQTPAPLPEPLLEAVHHVMGTGEKHEVEFACRRERIFSFVLAPSAGEGEVNLYGRDITARKRAEQEATLAATRLSNALDGLRALNATLEQRVMERTAIAERRAEQLRRLASQLAHAEERERHRVARILHDQLQQLLVGARLKVAMLRRRLDDDKLSQASSEIDLLIQQCLDESRALTRQLSPPVLYDAGLVAGLQWLARQMSQQWGLAVDVHASDAAEPADESIRVLLFQAVRELLLNVVKHAETKSARVEVTRLDNGRLRVGVFDEGAGFDPLAVQARADDGGFGLFSLRERLESMGGSFRVDTAPGEGTRATAEIPGNLAGPL